MKSVIAATVLAAFALAALADDGEAQAPRLSQLETLVVTATKAEPTPATQRLQELEIVVSTAPKAQPAEHEPSAKTAALLAEIAKEDE